MNQKILTTEVIMTFQDTNYQKVFNHRTSLFNDEKYSEYGLEKKLIRQIVFHTDKEELKKLVKLSLCVSSKDNTEEVMNDERISSIFKSKNGKYYFQPDQRYEVIAELCKECPEIAKDVLPYKEYAKRYPSKLEELIEKCKELLFNIKPDPLDPDDLLEDHKVSLFTKEKYANQ